jgi:hypothetical protein
MNIDGIVPLTQAKQVAYHSASDVPIVFRNVRREGVAMYRQIELLGLRCVISLRSLADNMWRSRRFGLMLIFVAGVGYLYWSYHIPSPGKAVAALAVVAAVMTFRGELSGLEKFFWTLVLFAFLFVELRAIDKDRATYASEQKEIRGKEAEQFNAIGEEIKLAIKQGQDNFATTATGLSTTIRAVEKTIGNTEPRALIRIADVRPVTNNMRANTPFEFNIWFVNIGNEVATNVIEDGRAYVRKPDDLAVEKEISKDFNKWWVASEHKEPDTTSPSDPSTFFTFKQTFSQSELHAISQHLETIYVIVRFEYSDHRGRWSTDLCLSYQDLMHDLTVAHPCGREYSNPHYVVRQR